jgi:hypothetical protein
VGNAHGCLDEGVKVGRRAAARARYELAYTALIDTHATVDPIHLAAVVLTSFNFFWTICRIPVRPFDYMVKVETRG